MSGDPRFETLKIPTSVGIIYSALARPWHGGDFPLVIMLHGALRTSIDLADWGLRLRGIADVALFDLPGHGKSAAPEKGSVEDISAVMAEAIRTGFPGRKALIVGESLGGTIGLALGGMDDPGPIRAIFAADPPMSTTKLWAVQYSFRVRTLQRESDSFFSRVERDTFGIWPDGLSEIVYYPLLKELKLPVLIASGDVPMNPQRQLSVPPNLFDGVDEYIATTLFPGKVEFQRLINCGHLILSDAPDTCVDIIKRMLTKYV